MKLNKLDVYLNANHVGTLAMTADKMVAFEYTDSWIENGFSISPFSLPLKKQVFIPTKQAFDGLFGVFADSLPDAWGNILLNRVLRKNGIRVEEITVLDRLAIVGDAGMGNLSYKPKNELVSDFSSYDLDEMAKECEKILSTQESECLDELYMLGGTSGGARPKIMPIIDNEHWIIKFPSRFDDINVGQMEYDYSICAKKCGIEMTETRLFDSKRCNGYFGIKRFDREKNKKVHMLTAAALLELDYRQPSMDYHTLMKLTKILTRDNTIDIENMFRRACFNVFAHNRDDHAKNFSFVYDDMEKRWRLSPAYDLTYSTTYYGEHTTTVDGNGINPGVKELLAVGTSAGMSKNKCQIIINEIKGCIEQMLSEYIKQSR